MMMGDLELLPSKSPSSSPLPPRIANTRVLPKTYSDDLDTPSLCRAEHPNTRRNTYSKRHPPAAMAL